VRVDVDDTTIKLPLNLSQNVSQTTSHVLDVWKELDTVLQVSVAQSNYYNQATTNMVSNHVHINNNIIEDENTIDVQLVDTHSISNNTVHSSAVELQDMKYSWRYPLLYDEMHKGAEDLIMTAIRILEEINCSESYNNDGKSGSYSNINSTISFNLLNEARMFIEYESTRYHKKSP
jgi:hypothetical protein